MGHIEEIQQVRVYEIWNDAKDRKQTFWNTILMIGNASRQKATLITAYCL